jgi:hypothetical protein
MASVVVASEELNIKVPVHGIRNLKLEIGNWKKQKHANALSNF